MLYRNHLALLKVHGDIRHLETVDAAHSNQSARSWRHTHLEIYGGAAFIEYHVHGDIRHLEKTPFKTHPR